MKLAHFSDIHVTHFPLRSQWALKRAAAVLSVTVGGRGAHFKNSSERIARLLSDVDAQQVDHALCTGDLTGVATEDEFQEVAGLFGERRSDPSRFTVIPGNHDRYVPDSLGRFERYFGALCEGGRFPLLKHLNDKVSLVAIDVCRPTAIVDSSGLCGESQLEKLHAILSDPSMKERFVILALHYGLMKKNGEPDRRSHGLRDDQALIELIDREEVSLDMVVHGHLHAPFIARTKRRSIVNVGSATDLHTQGCGYHLYEIDPEAHRVRIVRREWDPATGAYGPAPHSPLCRELSTR